MSSSAKFYFLSPSSIGLFEECPRCFWLQVKKNIRRPPSPFPSLPGGMDLVIKKYFDRYRTSEEGLPPELIDQVEGRLFADQGKLERWRNWRIGLRWRSPELAIEVGGALDDCLVDNNGKHFMPLDYKTRGFEVKPTTSGYYQHQLDIYALLLEKNGYPINGLAWLVYYYPEAVDEFSLVRFNTKAKKMAVESRRAEATLKKAGEVLAGPMPASSPECGFCSWRNLDFSNLE